MVNRTEHILRNCVKGFRSRKVVLEDTSAFKTDCDKKEKLSYVNFIEFKNKTDSLYTTPCSRWLENIFAENDVKVLRNKLNMLSFLKAGKRFITYWDALSKE